jgi:hypothetical protein
MFHLQLDRGQDKLTPFLGAGFTANPEDGGVALYKHSILSMWMSSALQYMFAQLKLYALCALCFCHLLC